MAEEVGFEPTLPLGKAVFKTAALNHSATPPLQVDTKRAEVSGNRLLAGGRSAFRGKSPAAYGTFHAKITVPGRAMEKAEIFLQKDGFFC